MANRMWGKCISTYMQYLDNFHRDAFAYRLKTLSANIQLSLVLVTWPFAKTTSENEYLYRAMKKFFAPAKWNLFYVLISYEFDVLNLWSAFQLI